MYSVLFPYPVTVSIGRPLPPGSGSFEARQAVMALSAEAFALRGVKAAHIEKDGLYLVYYGYLEEESGVFVPRWAWSMRLVGS